MDYLSSFNSELKPNNSKFLHILDLPVLVTLHKSVLSRVASISLGKEHHDALNMTILTPRLSFSGYYLINLFYVAVLSSHFIHFNAEFFNDFFVKWSCVVFHGENHRNFVYLKYCAYSIMSFTISFCQDNSIFES